jgi:xylan 1,4-beta-xylosidase
LNLQGINKPAFYSYKFMNQLGKTELQNADSCSWVCKDAKGNVQVLLWDFTNTHPGDSVNNQVYYVRDLPAKSKGKVNLSDISKGTYKLEIYKVGYHVNDPYSTYLSMKTPKQLTKQQVEQIKKLNDGSLFFSEMINIKANGIFTKELDLRENDVYFLNIIKQNR